MKHDDQHCTLIAIFWSEQQFFCRSTMERVYCILLEHVHGILLDQKFLYKVRARRLREHEVVRGVVGSAPSFWTRSSTMSGAQVCSRGAPGQPCNSHHARHTGQDTLVVPCLRCGSFLCHKSVGGRSCGQQRVLMRFSTAQWPDLPAATRRIFVGVTVHHSCWLCFTASLCVCSAQSRHCLCFFRRVSPLFCVSSWFPQGSRHCFVFRCFFLRLAQHAHAVFARNSVHRSPNPQFLSTSITKIDGSCSAPSVAGCTTARQAM